MFRLFDIIYSLRNAYWMQQIVDMETLRFGVGWCQWILVGGDDAAGRGWVVGDV